MKNYYWIILTLAMVSCSNSNNLSAFQWLQGRWDYLALEPQSYESWQLLEDGTMHGKGFSIVDGQAYQVEDMTISTVNEKIVFTLRVEPGGQTVILPLEHCSADSIVFSNPNADFPKQLTYIKLSDTTRQTRLSGKLNDKQTDMAFALKKQPE